MTRRSLFTASAAAAAVTLLVASTSASAATTSRPAAGRATSSLTLLDLLVGGHAFHVGDVALTSDTISSPHVSSVTLTPINVDGTSYGAQSVDPASSPKSVAAVASPGALAAFAALTSPGMDVSATTAPASHLGTSSLGGLKVLGLPMTLSGAAEAATSVSRTAGARGSKTITLSNLNLPSIADLLTALGLDLSKLPVATLSSLVDQLSLVTGAITTAQGVVDSAQTAVTSATSSLAAKNATLAGATGVLTTAQGVASTATAALQSDLNQIASTPSLALILAANPGINTIAGYSALVTAASPVIAVVNAAISGLASDYTSYVDAQAAVTTALTAVAAAQAVVDTAQALLTTVTNTLNAAIATLKGLLVGALDSTPLVSLALLQVSTKAAVTSAATGGQKAEIIGGTVKGLKVLGTDVLSTALGSSTLDLGTVTAPALASVNAAIATLTGTLSTVLSTVPSLPALDIPAPKITLLSKTATTSISGGYGRASTVVQGLSITIPAITLPSSLAVPNAAALPGLAGVSQVAGLLSSAPITLSLLSLRDQAAFRPALGSGATSGSNNTGGLPSTGLPTGVAVMSLLLVGGALIVRRRMVLTG